MTEKAKAAKEYLEKIRSINMDIEENMLVLEKLRENVTRTTAFISDAPRPERSGNSTERKFIDYIDRSDSIIKKIREQSDELLITADKIRSQINSIDEPRYRKVLSARFLRLRSWVDIADEMGYTEEKSVRRLCEAALTAFFDEFLA